jgi:CheY-like chemotaxis protein
MTKVLIAMSSDDLCHVLEDLLTCKFSVTCCQDGKTALSLLQELRPEVLILDLSLPERDGITLLEDAKDFRPPIILATINIDSPYIRDAAEDVGIGYIIKLPGDTNAMITRLLDMINRHNKAKIRQRTNETQTSQLLLELDFATNLDGYRYLQVAIPLFAEDPAQRICKELYPAVARLLGVSGNNNIERSIRSAIEDAWVRRDPAVWDTYFPPGMVTREKGPSNKLFIARMAEELNQR